MSLAGVDGAFPLASISQSSAEISSRSGSSARFVRSIVALRAEGPSAIATGLMTSCAAFAAVAESDEQTNANASAARAIRSG